MFLCILINIVTNTPSCRSCMMLSENISTVLVVLICIDSKLVNGDSITNVENVLHNLFSPATYNKEIRGTLEQTQAVDVNLSFALKYIKSLNEIEETIESFGVLFLSWKDERLIWDPNDYNGTDRVYITADKIWRPEVTLENPSTSQNFFGDVTRMKSLHKSNGEASLNIGDLFETSCSFDLTAFPWDKQKCSINLVVWGYSAEEVKLVAAQDTIDMQGYQSNGVWDLLSTKVYSKPHPQKSFIAFEVVLQRRPLFFVINILLPMATLSILELFVFIVPVDSGERISFSLTVLLSIAVYMTLIGGSLPPGAETMASMCYLLLFILIKSSFICLLNIISVKLYLRYIENPQISTFWCRFVGIFGELKCCHRPGKVDDEHEISTKELDASDEGSLRNVERSDINKERTYSWKNVSKTFDRVVAIFMTFLLCFGFSFYTYHVVTGIHVSE